MFSSFWCGSKFFPPSDTSTFSFEKYDGKNEEIKEFVNTEKCSLQIQSTESGAVNATTIGCLCRNVNKFVKM
jgi:hypothetical protein